MEGFCITFQSEGSLEAVVVPLDGQDVTHYSVKNNSTIEPLTRMIGRPIVVSREEVITLKYIAFN
jgi:hypothetical protein